MIFTKKNTFLFYHSENINQSAFSIFHFRYANSKLQQLHTRQSPTLDIHMSDERLLLSLVRINISTTSILRAHIYIYIYAHVHTFIRIRLRARIIGTRGAVASKLCVRFTAVDPANSEPNRPRQSTQPTRERAKTHTHNNKLALTYTHTHPGKHAQNATQTRGPRTAHIHTHTHCWRELRLLEIAREFAQPLCVCAWCIYRVRLWAG